MSVSQDQSTLNAKTTFGPNDTYDSSKATPAQSVGSATAAGHGDHPIDDADDSNVTLPNSKVGPQNEDLNGEQMRAPGEGDVMKAQFDKKNAGWKQEESLTNSLDRKKAEQAEAREDVMAMRQDGVNVDGGAGNRLENEGISQA